MVRRWFKKKPEKCNREDVRFFLLLCNGCDPDTDTDISLRVGASPFTLCRTLLSLESFGRDIIEPLLLGRLPAFSPFSTEQQATLKLGFKRHFGISAASPELADRLSCMRVAVKSDRFLRAVEGSSIAVSGSWLREKLADIPAAPTATLVGAVESISAGHVAGYAFSKADINKRLTIEIFVNGEFVGTTRTETQRRDIQEVFGGDGLSGFRLDFDLPQHLASQDSLKVHAFDYDSKVAICKGQTLHNFSVRHEHYLSRLLGELAAIRANPEAGTDSILSCLDRIEQQLPKIKQFAALPIEDYSLHARLFRPSTQPQLNQPAPVALEVDPAEIQAPVDADILVFSGPDEELADHAVEHIKAAALAAPEAVIFFADHDIRTPAGDVENPTFKAAFDYDLLLACPGYAGAYAIKRDAFEKLGGFTLEAGTAMHQDLWLRTYEAYGAQGFSHVDMVLWHQTPGRSAPSITDSQGVLEHHFRRLNIPALASPHQDRWGGDAAGLMQINWPKAEPTPKLAVIIPTRDAYDLTRNCVESLHATLAFPDQTEIIVVDNGSTDDALLQWLDRADAAGEITVIRSDMAFNWSALNNLAARQTDAEYLLFLNNDTEATDAGWDAVLRGQLAREGVGTVGARLFFEDGTIQFSGYVFEPDRIAVKKNYGESPRSGGYLHLSQLTHECSALIGAFLACRRATFDQLGGFDEALGVAFNDIEFTIRTSSLGLRNLYCPEINFYHYESKTRGYDAMDPEKKMREQKERALLLEKHGEKLARDLHYPRAFISCEPTYTLLAPPKE